MVVQSHFSSVQVRFECLQLVMLCSVFRYNEKVFMIASVGKSECNTIQQMLVTGKKKLTPAGQ